MPKPRILIIENAVDITGGLNSALRSSTVLSSEFDFAFIVPKNSKAVGPIQQQKFEVSTFSFVEIRKNIGTAFIYIPMLLYNSGRLFFMQRKTPSALLVTNDFYNLLAPVYKLLGGRVPYICFIRFLPSRFPRPLVRFWLAMHKRYAERIIAVSDAVLKELPADPKIIKINDPLPASLKLPYQLNENSKTVLCLANYIKGKGQESVLASFAKIHTSFPGWRLRFAGSDMGLAKNIEFKKSLIADAGSLGIADKTEWSGAVNNPAEEFARCSFSVNFSESESFSLTCVESLFAGRPVIATRSGGPSEIIDDGVTGLLVPVGDIAAMADALYRMMSDKELRESMSREAFVAIRRKFDKSATTSKLAGVYLSLVKPDKGS